MPRQEPVELVTATWPHLCVPDLPCLGVEFEPLRAAVPIGPGGFQGAGDIHKGVVRRYPTIVMHAMDLAIRKAEVLDAQVIMSAFHADADIDVPLMVKADASPGGQVRGGRVGFYIGLPDRLFIDPRAIFNSATDELVHGYRLFRAATLLVAIATTIRVVKVDPSIVLEIRMNGHIQHPAKPHDLPPGNSSIVIDLRGAGDELGLLAVLRDDAQAAHLFCQ